MYQKLILLILGQTWLMALTRGEDLESPQDGAAAGLQLHNGVANCQEDFNQVLCDFPDIFEACEKNSEFEQNCKFSCSLSGQLWGAAWYGNLEQVNAALTIGANPLCQKAQGTAIHMAALANHPEVVKALLDAGVNVNLQTTEGITPTYAASSNDSIDALNVLIEHNANVSIVGHYRELTPLIKAAQQGHLRVAQALINANASIDGGDKYGETALQYAAENGNHEMVSLLIEHNANVNIQDSSGWSPLIAAARWGHLDAVKALINANASIDVAGGFLEGSALYYAVWYGHQDTALFLIEHNANVNQHYFNTWTPLMAAAWDGHLNIAKALINANASLDAIAFNPNASLGSFSSLGATALHYAAERNHQDIVVLLIESGTSLDAKDKLGNTALHYAAKYNNQDIAVLLIERGAYTRMLNKEGDNPADESRLAGHNQLAELIESYTNRCRVLRHKWC